MSTIGRLAAALAVAFFLLAAPAGAAPRAVPPGHSGASQYTETLPTGGGETPTAEIGGGAAVGGADGGHGSGGGQGGSPGAGRATPESGATDGGAAAASSPAQALGTKNAKRLEGLGAEGKAAARLAAAAGAPAKAAIGGARPASGTDGSSPVKQVVGELTGTSDSGGMGLLLPLLIVMTVLVAAGFVLTRRRPVEPRE